MDAPPFTKEGHVNFTIPGSSETTQTYYRIFGDLHAPDSLPPLVVLHGGPGMCCDYTWPLGRLLSSHKIPVITYDQIGNGRSTHLPERKGQGDFWSVDLFIAELNNLLDQLLGDSSCSHCHHGRQFSVLGHSWGGMLAASYATRRPTGLLKIVVSNSPAKIETWIEACEKLRAELPKDVEATLRKHEADGTTSTKEYEDAVEVFYERHFCRVKPVPQLAQISVEWVRKDPTTYETMNGPSEFYVIGSLKDWSIEEELHKINVPTLVLNGEFDEAQDECVKPYVDLIAGAKWHKFSEASHMSYFEQPEEYLQVVGDFLVLK